MTPPAERAVRRRAAAHRGRARARDRSRRSCWPTSRRETSITRTRSGCTTCSTELARDLEIAMVVVTHNRSLAARADRVLLLEDGRLVESRRRGGGALMLCDVCGERDAVVHLTTIVNNEVTPAASVREVRGGARSRDDRRGARSIRSATSCTRCSSSWRRRRPSTAGAPSAAPRCATSGRPGGWGAPAATRRSRRACASCCGACTGTRGTRGARISRPSRSWMSVLRSLAS